MSKSMNSAYSETLNEKDVKCHFNWNDLDVVAKDKDEDINKIRPTNEYPKHAIDCLCTDNCSGTVRDLIFELYALVNTHAHKHTPYVTFEKDEILPIVCALYVLTDDRRLKDDVMEGPISDEEKDKRVAYDTIRRLMDRPNLYAATHDEVTNVYKLFLKAYGKPEQELYDWHLGDWLLRPSAIMDEDR